MLASATCWRLDLPCPFGVIRPYLELNHDEQFHWRHDCDGCRSTIGETLAIDGGKPSTNRLTTVPSMKSNYVGESTPANAFEQDRIRVLPLREDGDWQMRRSTIQVASTTGVNSGQANFGNEVMQPHAHIFTYT